MHAFWLMSQRDQSLSEAIPNIIKAYNSLKVAMEARAREVEKAAQEAALAEEAGQMSSRQVFQIVYFET